MPFRPPLKYIKKKKIYSTNTIFCSIISSNNNNWCFCSIIYSNNNNWCFCCCCRITYWGSKPSNNKSINTPLFMKKYPLKIKCFFLLKKEYFLYRNDSRMYAATKRKVFSAKKINLTNFEKSMYQRPKFNSFYIFQNM